ncbi:LAFA_0B06634g1_1 [Lachancea sp. 'fantastica']|nr:LAFA_0B06634g1_1 [Lachancea sp. 'fantastica']
MKPGSFKTFTRQFQVYTLLYGSQVKSKLKHFERHNKVIRRTPVEQEREAGRQRLRLKKLNKTAYSKQQAEHVLKKKYDISNTSLSGTSLGPTSASDVQYLKLAHDKRLMFTILGVTGEQLRDSKLVAGDVSKFLARGQLEKAIFLARLAKSRGVVGMNKIIEHFCWKQQDGKSAIDIYNWRKKWGIPPNEFTATILFDGLAKSRQPLAHKQAQRVLRIAMQLITNGKMNIIEFNAALNALFNSKDQEFVFQLFDARPKGLVCDAITYTTLLRSAAKMDSDDLCLKRVDAIMATVPKRFLDARLIYEYCRAWHCRSDKALSSVAASAIFKYFKLENIAFEGKIPNGVTLPELQYWDVQKKYDVNGYVIELLLENHAKNGKCMLAWKTYQEMIAQRPQMLTPSAFEKMIRIVTAGFPNACSSMAVQIFDQLDSRHKINKASLVLVYKAFERQAGRKFTNESPLKSSELIANLFRFAVKFDGKTQNLPGSNSVLDWRAWMFCWNVISRANEKQALDKRRTEWILNQYIDTLLSGQMNFSKLTKEEYPGLRHVSIEGVRFLGAFAETFKNAEQSIEPADGLERENFLYRRLLLRLKDRLLAYVAILEGKMNNFESVEESLRQTAHKLRTTKMPVGIEEVPEAKMSTQDERSL